MTYNGLDIPLKSLKIRGKTSLYYPKKSFKLKLDKKIAIAGSELNMQEGKWEITTKTEMVGMSMSMPPMTRTQCLTKKDLVPQDSQQGSECKITDTKVVGNTVTWTIKCHGHGGGGG